jgi:hypothetical protein
METDELKVLLQKLSQALDLKSPLATTSQDNTIEDIGETQHLVVENPWTRESYSWGEDITTSSFRIPYHCISTEFQNLSHAGRSLRMITLFLAYGVDGQQGIIELKKSQIREQYNFDTRTLERAIFELREAGLLVEIGRERNQRNKPMRYFVMVPISCFGRKEREFQRSVPQKPTISPPTTTLEKNAPVEQPAGKFPTPFEYKEAKEVVQGFYDLLNLSAEDKTDPGKLLSETLLACEMIRFYTKERILKGIAFLPSFKPFTSSKKAKSFRWFSSCIDSILETLEKPPRELPKKDDIGLPLTQGTSDDRQKKKLFWIRLSDSEQLTIKDQVLELYPFIKNEAVLDTIAQEMAYHKKR